ncbi:MAG: AMP-binding protein [Actinophytocola sp.]|uniref:class I adenylate-forming enzyme family protein n=1 Tax=Actinophytocola sp. TaxID=1872138 RepID=UPI00132B5EB6|nr:class I adenylate-forming enzyme family protein [Actinophytocola sp.]MPZ84152.1 AMP-binding protein [Actinophytocola sp.]
MTTPLRRLRPAPHADLPVGSADVLPRLAATAHPHRAALRAGNRTVSFAELDRDISRLGFGLRQLMGGDGLPVVVSATPGLDFPTAFYAVLRSGNVVAPANPRMPAETFASMLDRTGARAAVLSRAMYERVRPVLAGRTTLEQVLLLDAPAEAGQLTCAELAIRGGLLVEPRDRDENEVATLVHGAHLTHHELKARAAAVAVADGLRAGSVVLNATPSYDPTHLAAGIVGGATQVLYGNPSPAAAIREAGLVGATHLCVPDDAGVRTGHTVLAGEAVAS